MRTRMMIVLAGIAVCAAGALRPAVAQRDPADSIYRRGQASLSRGDYRRAAELFHRVGEAYPKSGVAGESLYYEAFSLYRSGGSDDLRDALGALKQLGLRYPSVARKSDARTLSTRICGELAKRGDERCAAQVVERADRAVEADRAAERASARAEGSARSERGERTERSAQGGRRSDCPDPNNDDDERVAALNALLQMNAESAMPILEKVLARRDACSAGLRRQATFLVSQKRTPRAADILLDVAKNDPDREVREQAVFWLSQVPDERAVDMLESILKSSSDDETKNKALFALSQHRSDRAQRILRTYAETESAPTELRAQSIFWLGQRRSQENADFLRGLYSRLRNDDLKDRLMFSLSQQRGFGNDKWLLDIALNDRENIELRKKAIFLASQSKETDVRQISALYDRMNDREMKDQIIFALTQRHETAAVDKLMDIAKNERDRELRKKAIFWLGQSRDPRVAQFLMDLAIPK